MRCVLLAREEKLVSARRRQIDSSALPPSLVGLARVSRIFSPFLILLAQPSQPTPGLLHSCCFCQRPPSARERWPNALPPGRVACSACRHLPSSLVAVSAAHLHPDRPTHAPVPEAICRGNPPAGYIERPSSSARLALRSLPPPLLNPSIRPRHGTRKDKRLAVSASSPRGPAHQQHFPFRKTNTRSHSPTKHTDRTLNKAPAASPAFLLPPSPGRPYFSTRRTLASRPVFHHVAPLIVLPSSFGPAHNANRTIPTRSTLYQSTHTLYPVCYCPV